MRQAIRAALRWAWRKTIVRPSPELLAEKARVARLEERLLSQIPTREERFREDYIERVAELIEARQMAGSGPWQTSPKVLEETDKLITASVVAIHTSTPLREAMDRFAESNPVTTAGAYGDIELALQNVEWRREVNLSWLEFSRWGIQQIILISRLHYIKNPIIRRLIEISSIYVFGRGVEVSSTDEDANKVLTDFFRQNNSVLGQAALTDLQKRKFYDGNLFFAFFSDTTATGEVNVRMIDATEIQDIITNPNDSDKPWFYKRIWAQRDFDPEAGTVSVVNKTAWYPALGYEPDDKPPKIGAFDVLWDAPILHRKCGCVSKWNFGCPIIYPALAWAKASTRFLEACATVRQAMATIAMTLTMKGGQQAIMGVKEQLQTSVNTGDGIWDQNPPPVNASIFAAGPGTALTPFKTTGAGGDPEEVRQFKLMCCMVAGVPETFLADVSTGNLATATTLDRPTELGFLSQQEEWREDLATIANWVLLVSKVATSGKLRASLERRQANPEQVAIMESPRELVKGRMVYVEKSAPANSIEVRVTFPNILEGDITTLVTAVVAAMTLGNKSGQVVGIDEVEGVRRLGELVGIEDVDEMVDAMYPKGEYDPDRTKEPIADPIPKPQPLPGGVPQNPDGKQPPTPTAEALSRLFNALKVHEAKHNGA